MNGYLKSTTLGDRECITIAPRKAYVREAPLTADWRRCRIGVYLSLVGAGSDNADCVAETLALLTQEDQFSFGISNGVGYVGQAGNQFVGLGRGVGSIQNYWTASNAYWHPLYNTSGVALTGSGATVATSSISSTLAPIHGPPSATSRFCGFLGADITLAANNTATVTPASNGANSPYGVTTDVGTMQLRAAMYASTFSGGGTVSGGWWGTGPCGCRHLYIRVPYYLSSLRIHAAHVMQLG